MIFTKGRIVGLCCTVATLIGAMVILYRVSSDNDLSRLGSLLKVNVLLMLFVLYASHFLAEPLRWVAYNRQSVTTSGQQETGFSKIFACFNITALLSYSLPFKLGLPLRLFLLSHFLQLEAKLIIKLMSMDGLFNLLCWLLISAPLYFLIPEISGFFSPSLNLLLIVGGTLVLVAGIVWLIKKQGLQLLLFIRAIPLSVLVLVLTTLVADILLYGVRHAVLASLLGIDISATRIFAIGIIAVCAGILSTLPMGLGAYDATLVALLALYGVEIETGLILALSNRLGMIITSIILGVPSSLALLNKNAAVKES